MVKKNNNVFETEWWLNTVAPDSWSAVEIKNENEIIARWPYVLSGKKIMMPKLTQTLGYYVVDAIVKNDYNFTKRKDIILELIEKMPCKKNIKINLDPSNSYFLPFIWEGFHVVPKITYRINDINNINDVYTRFSSMTKKNIRNSEKKLIIKSDEKIDDLIILLEKTFKLQNRKNPYPSELIKNIYKAAQKNEACYLLYAVDKDNNIHSGALYIYDEEIFYYLIGASNPKYRNSGSNSLIIWEGIQYASKVSKIFDFEGSMIEGIEHFFRGFGGIPTIYYEIRKQSILKEIFELLKPKIKKIIKFK
jgi:lipid II:glycine glycyltransferase (peptidoglycan interpeptide bridge formation enzyme)